MSIVVVEPSALSSPDLEDSAAAKNAVTRRPMSPCGRWSRMNL